MNPDIDIQALIERHARRDSSATDELFALLYDDLRRVAAGLYRGAGSGSTIQATALVHEAWMRLAENQPAASGKQAFLALAARVMRHLLIDHARARGAEKRGGGRRAVTMDLDLVPSTADVEPSALGECLERLAQLKERHAQVVELRIFAGLTIDETAEQLGVSTSTVESDWTMARAWLQRELTRDRV